MQSNYLIPANSKRGNLIFNVFRPIDLVIFLIGVGATLLLLLIIPGEGMIIMLAKMLPIFVGSALVMPVPNQHNILVLLGAAIRFVTTQQRYKWKGWCIYESFK